tara:strand:- start:46 stop:576 length:531 start_codon:yes stop_codon:yes gene_type:complete
MSDNITGQQYNAIIRQNPYQSKSHDIEDIKIHKRLFSPYGFNNWLCKDHKQKDKFMQLEKNNHVVIRQGRYGSNTRDNNRYLIGKIITDEPEISIIPEMYIVLDSEFYNDENIVKNYVNYVKHVGILKNREILDYLEQGFTIQPFKALNHKIEIISEETNSENYLLPYRKGSIVVY